jgi:serine/threonine protein kinase
MDLGPYEILEELGRGGMGRVYLARHRPTGARRALKALESVPDVEQLDRFRREVEALARVGGAGVVPIHDSGVAGRTLWFAMEIMSGGSLRARLKESGRLPWREATAIVADVARALGRCHAIGLVHRDVKPENILFDDQGAARLADFGCVRFLGGRALTVTGTFIGTPGYMSPEQLNGEPVGPSADVFALGVVLYELVQGTKPFTGNSVFELLRATTKPPAPLRDAPPELQRIVAGALAPSAADRTRDANQLAVDLDELVAGKTKAASRPPLVAALLLALVAAGALAFTLTRPRREPEPPPPIHEVAPTATHGVTPSESLDGRIATWKKRGTKVAASELADALRDFPGSGERLAAEAFRLGITGAELSPEVRAAFGTKGQLSSAVKAVETVQVELAKPEGPPLLWFILAAVTKPDPFAAQVDGERSLTKAWRALFLQGDHLHGTYPALVAPVFSSVEAFALEDLGRQDVRGSIVASPALIALRMALVDALDPGALPPVLRGALALPANPGLDPRVTNPQRIEELTVGGRALVARGDERLGALFLCSAVHVAHDDDGGRSLTPEVRALAPEAYRLICRSLDASENGLKRRALARAAVTALVEAYDWYQQPEAIDGLRDAFESARRESLEEADQSRAATALVNVLILLKQCARVDELLPEPPPAAKAAVLMGQACRQAELGDLAKAREILERARARAGPRPPPQLVSLLEKAEHYVSSPR